MDRRPNIVNCTLVSHKQLYPSTRPGIDFFVDILLAVFPWIALLFNAILIAILFAAARRRIEPEPSLQSSIVEREKQNSP